MSPLKILVIDDEQLIRWSFEKQLGARGYQVFTAETGEEGVKLFEQNFPEIVFVDNRLPGMQGLEVISKIKSLYEETNIIFMTAYGSIDTAVKAMKLGAVEYVTKPFTFKEIHPIVESIKEKIEVTREVALLRRQQKEKVTFDHIIGDSSVIRKVVQLAKKIAHIDSTTVLLLGESGTGKDFFARAIHNESMRNVRPFVTINCSSLPESLLESELFGYEQGAYTDAKKLKKGLFEMAEGGTVFLDEIGEINLATQVKLLGVIENRTFRRLGGTSDIPVNIRIIAATNKDLSRSITEKTFREDLFYRLKVFQISVPPLRDHPEDVGLLTGHFIRVFNSQFRKKISGAHPEVFTLLSQYEWPGNIRELRNVIERAVILETGEMLQPDSLPNEITSIRKEERRMPQTEKISEPQPGSLFTDGSSLYEQEKQTIIRALRNANQNKTKAARLLGITRDTLRYKLKKYHL